MTLVRLFAALELPGEVRTALASWGARVSAREPAIRLVSTASLHVTLVFLGPQDPEAVEEIGAAVVLAARPLDPLAIGGAAWLPPRRPGVLVADVVEDGGALSALQADLVTALRPWHEAEARGFRPHVTVARVGRGERISAREVPPPPRLSFDPAAVVLYRSRPAPGSSMYDAVARAEI